ncbi:Ras family GTPase [Histomonas meleagridis]|uniref:Ras family GTPase n=1 Tax=Histomonas meleagridis TaxID=135588 RepID=UPI003559969E|nr:Ras family GTPase [Histomonas meleagridis]KAH0798870.1 Ras family GTPase [Histomonas meleagridis]
MATTIKVVVLGLGAVGKSCLTVRFIKNTFQEEYEPTISDTYSKTISLNNHQYSIDVLDTAGMEETEAVGPQVYRDRDCFIIVYAINDRASFDNVNKVYNNIQRYKDSNQFPCIICANKIDLENDRVIKFEEGKALADKFSAQFLETSAKTGANVQEIMETAIREYLKFNNTVVPPPPEKECKCCNIF